MKYGEYYTIHVLKKETDEKGNDIQRIVPVQKCLASSLPRVRMICIAENGEYTSTDSFKYCSRVIHKELLLAFDYHSLRHPYVKPTTIKYLSKAEIPDYHILLVWGLCFRVYSYAAGFGWKMLVIIWHFQYWCWFNLINTAD